MYNPITDQQISDLLLEEFKHYLGRYITSSEVAFSYDKQSESDDVEGLEMILMPCLISNINLTDCTHSKRITWFIYLYQHKGRLTINTVKNMFDNYGKEQEIRPLSPNRFINSISAYVVKITVFC